MDIYYIDIIFEFMFLFNMIACFFHEYTETDTQETVSDLKMIAWNYLTGYFIFDLIAIIPITYIVYGTHGKETAEHWLYFKLARLIRLPLTLSLLSESRFDAFLDMVFNLYEQIFGDINRETKMRIRFISRYFYKIFS